MRVFCRVAFWSALFLFSLPASAQERSDALQTLIRKAHEARLSDAREWHLLLHNRVGLFGGIESDVDSPAFFLSTRGKHDPKAELEATLTAFFTPLPIAPLLHNSAHHPEIQHPQCQFPARYAWLKAQFDFFPVPPQVCERFDLWRARINAVSVTLIFAAADLSNPASMYGHTFLRFNQKRYGENGGAGEGLLDETVNFAAITDTQSGLAFAYHGLTGGYRGRFSTLPYYVKVREYANLQNRDLWEYDLALNPQQIERLVRHLWEMGSASFDYYFLTENCSYQLLPLLSVADPSLRLVEQFGPRVIPIDTVRILLMQPGLISSVRYRPSDWNRLLHQRAQLSKEDAEMARRLAEEGDPALDFSLSGRQPVRQAAILNTAYDYLQYRRRNVPDRIEVTPGYERRLLLRMSQMGRPPTSSPPLPSRPDAGHRTGRIGMGLGRAAHIPFEEISIRPALHDLAAPDAGYLPNSHLSMFDLRLRYDPKARNAFVEHLGLIEIISLHPRDPWVTPPSWKMNIRIDPAKERGCVQGWRCLYLGMNVGRGVVQEIRRNTGENIGKNIGWTGQFLRQATGYAFAEIDAGVGGVFNHDHRLGGGVTAGLLLSVAPFWRMHLTGGTLYYVAGDRHTTHSAAAEQLFSMGQEWEVRLLLRRASSHQETQITLNRYF